MPKGNTGYPSGTPSKAGPLTATGRVPGRAGMETRNKLLAEVERHCLIAHHRTISVGEIAAAAETSAATFYHYFPDMAAAAAEVAVNHLAEFDIVLDRARAVVQSESDLNSCRDLTAAFFDYWEHRPGLIEAIVVASRDEDPRFFKVLLHALVALTNILAEAAKSGHKTGIAGSLVMMLSQAAARRDGFARDGVAAVDLVESQAWILHAALQAGSDR